jgi:hypothetical protein
MNTIVSSGKYGYKCNSCARTGTVNCKDAIWQLLDSRIRKMGPERTHVATFDNTCSCGQNIWVELSASEYPMGVINHQDFQIRGATVIHKKNILIKIAPDKLF